MSEYIFSSWSTEAKVRSLQTMDTYLWEQRKQGKITEDTYRVSWGKYGVLFIPLKTQGKLDEALAEAKRIAEDDIAYTNAVFEFFCCVTTDMRWLERELFSKK